MTYIVRRVILTLGLVYHIDAEATAIMIFITAPTRGREKPNIRDAELKKYSQNL